MVYEIYVDMLFFLDFFLNIYMLALIDCIFYRVAGGRRIIPGAALGAFVSIFPIILPINLLLRMVIGFLLSLVVMCVYTFRTFRLKNVLLLMERMLLISVLLGGMLLFLLKWLPVERMGHFRLIVVLAIGAVSFLLIHRILVRKTQNECVCKVILEEGENRKEIRALIDTGNVLKEPISGKPVAVMEKSVLQDFYHGEWPQLYRIIPYHSVGKNHGILKGYLVDKLVVEIQGIPKECRNVYVAGSDEIQAGENGYQVILNPEILEK